jgi:nicotinamidase-related amidase
MAAQIFDLTIPQTLAELCNRRDMALVIYDMQAGIVSQIKNGGEITAKVARLVAAARGASIRTVFTRHLSLPKELMGSFQYRMAMAWQRTDDPEKVQPWFLRDTPPFAIVRELAPQPTEAIFDKLAMSAFEGTPLNFALRDCGIRAILIAGIAMEIGIEPTVRHAADLGFVPVVVTDACGSGHDEAAQRSIAAMQFTGDAILTDLDTICGLLGRTA